ncbi:alpha/beta fold hydrolase [Streptomyces hirsutus]|uniref:alpha/beta fold hydrolase n=1 Tax=Streptomyces hirsutus TaxID=35620 RepID=UPI0033205BE2
MGYITADDRARVFYPDRGNGQPIVFSHGRPPNADAEDKQTRLVAENGFRAIAHDRRGHGRSDQPWQGNDMDIYADDLARLIESLDLRDTILVGHSTGGGEAARHIGRHLTERTAKTVRHLSSAISSRSPAPKGPRLSMRMATPAALPGHGRRPPRRRRLRHRQIRAERHLPFPPPGTDSSTSMPGGTTVPQTPARPGAPSASTGRPGRQASCAGVASSSRPACRRLEGESRGWIRPTAVATGSAAGQAHLSHRGRSGPRRAPWSGGRSCASSWSRSPLISLRAPAGPRSPAARC